jgi:hypothetical protein
MVDLPEPFSPTRNVTGVSSERDVNACTSGSENGKPEAAAGNDLTETDFRNTIDIKFRETIIKSVLLYLKTGFFPTRGLVAR